MCDARTHVTHIYVMWLFANPFLNILDLKKICLPNMLLVLFFRESYMVNGSYVI